MPVPSFVKTWQFSVGVNVTGGDGPSTCKAAMLAIKNALVGFGTHPWTVVGSSKGSAAGMDAVDRWSTTADLTWANPGTNHSWIVLQQTGLNGASGNFQVLLDLQADGNNRTVWTTISPTGAFTGGSQTTAPTASDGIILYTSSGSIFTEGAVATSVYINAMMSTDGQSTRVFITNNATVASGVQGLCAFWQFEKVLGAPDAFPQPLAMIILGANQNFNNGGTYPLRRSDITDTDQGICKGIAPNTSITSTCTVMYAGEGRQYAATSLIANNEYDGQHEGASAQGWLLLPVSIWGSNGTTGNGVKARLGYLPDFWHAPDTGKTGDDFPADASKQLMRFGDMVTPWDGATAMPNQYAPTSRDCYTPAAGCCDGATVKVVPYQTPLVTVAPLGSRTLMSTFPPRPI